LEFLRDLGRTEIGGFGVSSLSQPLLIEDIRLVRQQCDWASVVLDDLAVADFFDEQVDGGRRPEEFARVWVHSHPGDSARPSLTDEETFARVFGSCDWALMLIVARGGESFARVQFRAGPGGGFEVPVEIAYDAPFGASEHAAWQSEYDACVEELAAPDTPGNSLELFGGQRDAFDLFRSDYEEYPIDPGGEC
jgi:JAB domain-containing protein similar to deubiquitination enzymes